MLEYADFMAGTIKYLMLLFKLAKLVSDYLKNAMRVLFFQKEKQHLGVLCPVA